MPAVFPALLPEEPLYSAIARYGEMMDFCSMALHRSVFGLRQVNVVIDLPGHIDRFLGRLLPGHGYSADQILDDHTALPYYAAFLPRGDASVLRQELRASGGRSTYLRFAINDSSSPPVGYLRFCQECVLKDRLATSEVAYWRRVHQLAGAVVCPTHGVALWDSDVSCSRRSARAREFISLERAVARSGGRKIGVPRNRLKIAQAVAEESLWLLQNYDKTKEWQSDSAQELWERCRRWCCSLGWGTPGNARVRRRELLAELRAELATMF